MKKLVFCLLCFCLLWETRAQDNPFHTSHRSVYEFLDEMANLHLIELNSAIKPYSRTFVVEKLNEVETQIEKLNNVQKKELKFHLLEFNIENNAPKSDYKINILPKREHSNICLYPLGGYFSSKWFKLAIKPIWGGEFYAYSLNKNGFAYRYWGGGEMTGYIGKHFAFYVNVTDNSQSKPMSTPDKLTQMQGAILKGQEGHTDFFNVRGGISFAWKWGSVGLIHDNITWGNAYNGSNIFSGRTLPYAMIKFKLNPVEWFEYNYFHGALSSNVIDSNASYVTSNGKQRTVMRDKYIAASILTFRPIKNLYFNIGNSVVYSDVGFQFMYLIPFMFYKAVDDNYNATSNSAGHNTQLFFDISCRNLKYVHFYTSMFIDELSIKRMFDKEKHSNYISWKAGFCFSGLPKTFSLTFEYTRTNPNTYQHFIPATAFTTGDINLGHYLGSNAEEYFVQLGYRPIPRLSLKASYTYLRKGTDYIYGEGEPWGLPFMQQVIYYNHITTLKVEWEWMNNCFVYAHLQYYKTDGREGMVQKYNPAYMQKTSGIPLVLMLGFNIGI